MLRTFHRLADRLNCGHRPLGFLLSVKVSRQGGVDKEDLVPSDVDKGLVPIIVST